MLEKEQERVLIAVDGTALQHAKYLNGVGDSDNFLVKLLGGALGAGLIKKLPEGAEEGREEEEEDRDRRRFHEVRARVEQRAGEW